jgi:hypothetical protein
MTKQLDLRTSRYYFQGDLFDRSIRYPVYLQRLQEHEKTILLGIEKEIGVLRKAGFILLEWLLRRATTDVGFSPVKQNKIKQDAGGN